MEIEQNTPMQQPKQMPRTNAKPLEQGFQATNQPPQYPGEQAPQRAPRKRRRKLKRKVKYTLYGIVLVVCLLAIRPWSWAMPSSCKAMAAGDSICGDTVIPLNVRLSGSVCEIPQSAKFDKTVRQFIRRWEIQGASLAVMKDGNLIYYKGYGYADAENRDTVEVKHIFRMASVSKLITAVGIMKLQEQGKLRLSATVFGPNGILPQFKEYTDKRVEKITVEQLLRHKAGFTIRSGDPMFSPLTMELARRAGQQKALTTDQMIAYVIKAGLGYTPGNNTKYSNFGYTLLSRVIEQVSGMEYEQYIKTEILSPIGCHDMHLAHNVDSMRHTNEVKYYESSDAEPVESCDGSGKMVQKCNGGNDVQGLLGAGAWVASPVEMLMFVSAIDGDPGKPDILKPSTIAQMVSCTNSELPMGWMKVKANGNWIRTGSMAGTSAMLCKQSDGYTWIFVTNTSSWKGARFTRLISGMVNSAFGRVDQWPEKDMFDTMNLEDF